MQRLDWKAVNADVAMRIQDARRHARDMPTFAEVHALFEEAANMPIDMLLLAQQGRTDDDKARFVRTWRDFMARAAALRARILRFFQVDTRATSAARGDAPAPTPAMLAAAKRHIELALERVSALKGGGARGLDRYASALEIFYDACCDGGALHQVLSLRCAQLKVIQASTAPSAKTTHPFDDAHTADAQRLTQRCERAQLLCHSVLDAVDMMVGDSMASIAFSSGSVVPGARGAIADLDRLQRVLVARLPKGVDGDDVYPRVYAKALRAPWAHVNGVVAAAALSWWTYAPHRAAWSDLLDGRCVAGGGDEAPLALSANERIVLERLRAQASRPA